jgi:DNA mismatch repair protein MutL
MNDIIHLLPDSIANQIAAGEVIQRPSSVIKELVENSIDAGASKIQVIIKDAGRTLIQVIDDGKGMSETDARMAFERHATSKIQTANDLFSLRTMGFRGEALASIAAIAHIELKTRREEDELGTSIIIAGSKVESQSKISISRGSNFSVKNLFFNVPARRKFLKAETTELKHIINDFQRIALVYPEIEFELYHNDQLIHDLRVSNSRQRIINIFGKTLNNQLLEIKEENDLIKISGFVGKPEYARKQAYSYFFVNGRFMNHPYFHRAVMQAYDKMLPGNVKPNYFIYFNVDPANIDVNVHPTKTEIKFENESAIWSMLMAIIKESLGKFNMLPPLTFEDEVEIINNFVPTKEVVSSAPKVNINPDYNPFNVVSGENLNSGGKLNAKPEYSRRPTLDWEKLYEGFEHKTQNNTNHDDIVQETSPVSSEKQALIEHNEEISKLKLLQLHKRYIVSTTETDIILIDQHRAHYRILFEENIKRIADKKANAQTLLFPEVLEVDPADVPIYRKIQDDLQSLGFDLSDFGKNSFQINAIPANMNATTIIPVIEQIIDDEKNEMLQNAKADFREVLAKSMAKSVAIKTGQQLTSEEMAEIYYRLSLTSNPNYDPEGKPIRSVIGEKEIEKRF